jgi:predicted transcriptional regulator
VLDVVWSLRRQVSGRDVHEAFPQLAYTTLTTTLDRLHRKGLLRRHKNGRAFQYSARYSRDELSARRAADALGDLLAGTGEGRAVAPLLSSFVDAVTARDRALLDELERLVRDRRRGTPGR